MPFPATRSRRLRRTSSLRGLVRETALRASDFIYPLFVADGLSGRRPFPSLPGIEHLSIDESVTEAGVTSALGIPAVLLFGLPTEEDEHGTAAWDSEGVVQLTIQAIKAAHPEVLVITDVCVCNYTTHGHCGILSEDGTVNNDSTLELLARVAVSHARAGADAVAPSDMMDGNVSAVRTALDEEEFDEVPIIAYSAKYASSFYGPFRDAVQSAPQFGDRRSHQMDPANSNEALREVELDIGEGADAVMIKPALPYLDVIRRVKDQTNIPVVAYNVSGEYAMVKAAAEKGWLDERAAVLEVLAGIRRAGADIIISYHAKQAAEWL